MIPVHVDTLYLEHSRTVVEATSDFRGLPYYDSQEQRDVNSDIPWLGESVTAQPFENSNMTLRAGVHLHWALPDGLCHGVINEENQLKMPAVPNRWLIRRRKTTGLSEQCWIVESDYLWPSADQAPAVNIFVEPAHGERPYRFMGRQLTLEDWLMEPQQPRDYLEPLTVMGHGDPAFAAYYPNCMTVFGFHDREPTLLENRQHESLHYDVVGWYSETQAIPPLTWQQEEQSSTVVEPFRGWRLPDAPTQLRQLVCYASAELNAPGMAARSPVSPSTDSLVIPKVAIANTVLEALSALLAQEIAGDDRAAVRILEEQLAYLQLDGQMDNQQHRPIDNLDLQRQRHQASFEASSGPSGWTIQTSPPGASPPSAPLLQLLRQLNQRQADYGRQLNQLTQARRQLYGDWCHYMRCAYRPTDGGRGQYLDMDEVVTFIQTRSQYQVDRLQWKTDALQAEVYRLKLTLQDGICQLNQQLNAEPNDTRPPQYQLIPTPGARYWHPTEPVVLIAGTEASPRHGQDGRQSADGRLLCEQSAAVFQEIQRYQQGRPFSASAIKSPPFQDVFNWLETAWKDHPPDAAGISTCIGFRRIQQPPWNPVFLDWGIDLHPAEARPASATSLASGRSTAETLGRYDPQVIKHNYRLGSRQPDLHSDALWTNDNPDRFSGRCLLGDAPALILKAQLEHTLRRRLLTRLMVLAERPAEQSLTAYVTELFDAAQRQVAPETDSKADSDLDPITARAVVRALVELWMDPDEAWSSSRPIAVTASESDSQNPAVDYLEDLKEWYQQLDSWPTSWLQPLATEPREPLPTTPAALTALVDWYRARPLRGDDRTFDPLHGLLLAYQKLFANGTDKGAEDAPLRLRTFVAQTLSGFNAELLQWKQSLALPIEEPIGLVPYADFTRSLAARVGDETDWIPEPTNNFSPIRSGALKLDKLQLIDSFGQTQTVPCDEQTIVPSVYQVAGRPGVAFLPPRLVQPARVTFRWLAAQSQVLSDDLAVTTGPAFEPQQEQGHSQQQESELLAAAAQSPICGWLLPEKLRRRLLVFDGTGHPLGALAIDRSEANGGTAQPTLEWVRAPGLPRLTDADCEAGCQWLAQVSPRYYEAVASTLDKTAQRDLGELGASISHPRLARVLLYLWATRSGTYLDHFLDTLDDATSNIDPDSTTSLGSLALLMGRPVAVVGAELDLQLRDDPAIRQDWEAFRRDQHRHQRDTDDFTQVEFRLRLGQYQSRQDGILGYWLETPDGGFDNDTFVAQAADENADPNQQLEITETLPGIQAKINVHDGGSADGLNFCQSVAAPPLKTTLLFDPRGKAHLTTGILPVKAIDIPRPLWEPALEAIQVWLPVAPFLTRTRSRRVPIPTLVDRQWHWIESLERNVWQTLLPTPTVDRTEVETHLADLATPPLNLQPPTLATLIQKAWLVPAPGDRLTIAGPDDRQPLDNPALEAPLDDLLAQIAIALESPGDEPDFNPGIEVRSGWLLLAASPTDRQP